jgi:hypothetical protein
MALQMDLKAVAVSRTAAFLEYQKEWILPDSKTSRLSWNSSDIKLSVRRTGMD